MIHFRETCKRNKNLLTFAGNRRGYFEQNENLTVTEKLPEDMSSDMEQKQPTCL